MSSNYKKAQNKSVLKNLLRAAVTGAIVYVAVKAWNSYQKTLLDYSVELPKVPVLDPTYERFETKRRTIEFQPCFRKRVTIKETPSILDNAAHVDELDMNLAGRYYRRD